MFAIYLFNNLILLSLYFWYNHQLFEMKLSKKVNIYIIVIFALIKAIFNLFNYYQLNFTLTLLTYSFIVIIFSGSFIKKILFNILFIIISFFTEICAIFLLDSIDIFKRITNFSYYLLLGNIINLIIIFTIILIFTKIYNLKKISDYKEIWYLSIFPIFTIIIIYLILDYNILDIFPHFGIFVTAIMIVFNIIICIGFTDIIKSKKVLLENEQLKNQKLNYQLMEEKFENSKRFVHSFKKHINILHNYISNHNYNEASQYINDLKLEISNNDNMIITNNPLINIEIYSKLDLINYNHINLRYDIKIKELFFVSPLDFNTVFSIILENAIDNCKESTGSLIKIKLDKKDDYIILKIINSSNKINKLKAHDLKTVKKIVAKYDGYYRFNYDNHLFISTIIFKNS
ncbi:MAG: GHKL domain-containing protein [Thomasclavelia sp.]